MAGTRKTHSSAFKAQVALAAVKGDKTINELAGQHAFHQVRQVARKRNLRNRTAALSMGMEKIAREKMRRGLYP